MPSAAVDAAFRGRLTDEWTGSPVLTPNSFTEPPEGETAFLVVQYPIVDGSKPSLGRRFFEEGAARLVLNVSVGTGLATGLALADSLAGLFRDWKPGTGFETFTPSPPIINDQNSDGNWYELAVIVPYRFQFNDGGPDSPA